MRFLLKFSLLFSSKGGSGFAKMAHIIATPSSRKSQASRFIDYRDLQPMRPNASDLAP